MTIQEKCVQINRQIHNKLFLNNYLKNGFGNYERVFTSLDLIEDCQDAIQEFESIPDKKINTRTTLYIYSVLQSLYCQQDGLFHLYRTISDPGVKNVYELFKLYNFNKSIREVRDDIAGHPSDRKKGKEYYFIGKGSNSKYKFSYAGYTPKFRKVDVDLKSFIEEQYNFAQEILNHIENEISKKIKEHKKKFKEMKLYDIVNDLNYSKQLIYRGITNNHPLANSGLNVIEKELNKLKQELNKRYNNDIPEGTRDIFRLVNHIIDKIKYWISKHELHNNLDAEVFMDSFDNQLAELGEIMKEIDDDFEN